MSALQLRQWQAEFARAYVDHDRDDFLLVACPAAGKTIGAGAGVSAVMERHQADQLVVVCPTVVVRDQWAAELGKLGYRMTTRLERGGWPEWTHGICATYSQVAYRAESFAEAIAERRTVAIFDEIHHAGERQAWGDGISVAFAGAVSRLHLSGTPFRSDGRTIPFVRYGEEGSCVPDFAYDYPQAVRDGVCRAVEFHAHDGVVAWREGPEERTAAFSDQVEADARPRRLRASLDPQKPYLRSLLEAADADLKKMRQEIPDAAGLVVCDTQPHALEVDRLLNEISGTVPTLAISDLPRAHHAITHFAEDLDEWLVSVRMVAEGVDIPRLGVIVWATTASTELMVRQVAGRALRGRPEHGTHPARIHMPADPRLIGYAERLDVLAGTARVERTRGERSAPPGERKRSPEIGRSKREIDPTPFVEWFDRKARYTDPAELLAGMGWSYDAGMRSLYRWRVEGAQAHVLTLYDLCHLAGIDFDELFAGEQYAEARAFVAEPAVADGRHLDFGSVHAEALGVEREIRPPLPAAPSTTAAKVAAKPVEISTPALPPSPAEIEEAELRRKAQRAELHRLLTTYTQLRRVAEPHFQLASAMAELVAEFGPVDADVDGETIGEAIDWINERAAALALENPDVVKQLAKARRRSRSLAAG